MRKSEIQVGKTYTDGKTNRLVLRLKGLGEYEPYVIYLRNKPWNGTVKGEMWLPYFARWAKSEVKEVEGEL